MERSWRRPGSRQLRWLAGIAAALAASAVFYGTLLLGGPLGHYDWSAHHYHYFDWVRISLARHHTLPLFMIDAKVTDNFIGNAEAPVLGPLIGLLPVLGTDAYIKLLIVLFSAAGLVGMFSLLRDLGASRALAAVPAVAFAFNGFFTAHLGVGHHWVMGAQLLPGLVLLLRRAAAGSTAAVWWAAVLNAVTILGGQHQPFIWQNLVLGAYAVLLALQRRSLAPVSGLLRILAWTAGLAAVKLLPMLAEFGDYRPDARTAGIPVRELASVLLGRGQGPTIRPPGFDYGSGAGWWEYAFYTGPLAVICLVAGLLALRRTWPLALIGGFFLLIAVAGSPFDGMWDLLVQLPVWRTQRSPSRFLFVAVFALLAIGGAGLQRLDGWARERWRSAAVGIAAVAAALVFADLYVEARPWQRAALGDGIESRSHRPRRSELRDGARAVATLREFAPNRLVWRIEADEAAHIVFPMRYAKGALERQRRGEDPGPAEWRVAGLPATADDGLLALDVPPGERDVVMRYRPRRFRAGLATTSATLLALGIAVHRSRRASRGRRRESARA
jgi:hypothetical protein